MAPHSRAHLWSPEDGRAAADAAWPWRRPRTANVCTKAYSSRAPELRVGKTHVSPAASPVGVSGQEDGAAGAQGLAELHRGIIRVAD